MPLDRNAGGELYVPPYANLNEAGVRWRLDDFGALALRRRFTLRDNAIMAFLTLSSFAIGLSGFRSGDWLPAVFFSLVALFFGAGGVLIALQRIELDASREGLRWRRNALKKGVPVEGFWSRDEVRGVRLRTARRARRIGSVLEGHVAVKVAGRWVSLAQGRAAKAEAFAEALSSALGVALERSEGEDREED